MFGQICYSRVKYRNVEKKTEVILKRNTFMGDNAFDVFIDGAKVQGLFYLDGGKYVHFKNRCLIEDFLKTLGIEKYTLSDE